MIAGNPANDFADVDSNKGTLPDWLHNYIDGQTTTSAPQKAQPSTVATPQQTKRHLDVASVINNCDNSTAVQPSDNTSAVRTLLMQSKAKSASVIAPNSKAVPSATPISRQIKVRVIRNTAAAREAKRANTARNAHRAIIEPTTLDRHFVHKPENLLNEAKESTVSTAQHTAVAINRHLIAEQPNRSVNTNPAINYAQADAELEKTAEKRLDKLTYLLLDAQKLNAEQSRPTKSLEPAKQHVEQTPLTDSIKRSKAADKRAAKKAAKAQKAAEATATKKTTPRKRFALPAIMMTATSFATVIAIGAYILMPTITIKVAAGQAGINAKNPYTPNGYSIYGAIAHKNGQVVINYSDRNNSKSYSISQTRSDQNNDDLRYEAAGIDNGDYRELKTNGVTVYLTSEQANWVRNGIRYSIKDSHNLSTDQITRIVNSL